MPMPKKAEETLPNRKVVLIAEEDKTISNAETSLIYGVFETENIDFIRMPPLDSKEYSWPWQQHLAYCMENLVPRRDVVIILPENLDFERIAAIVCQATKNGYIHLYFGQDGELYRITDVEVRSEPFRPRT